MEALNNAEKFARPNTRLILIVISNGNNLSKTNTVVVRESLKTPLLNSIKLTVAGDSDGVESLKAYFNGSIKQEIFNAKRQNDYQVHILLIRNLYI